MFAKPIGLMGDPEREAKEDLFYGQVVIIVARWFLIAAGIVLSLWAARSVMEVAAPTVFIVVLMAVNFYLHGRYIVTQPVNAALVLITSAIDLAIVMLMIWAWSGRYGAGIENPFYVLLYPSLLAFALVFPPRATIGYAALGIGAYVMLVFLTSGFGDVEAQKTLVQRVVTLGATAGLGALYWRIQRRRRAATPDLVWGTSSLGQPEPAR